MGSFRSDRDSYGRRRTGRRLRLVNVFAAMIFMLGVIAVVGIVAVYINPEIIPAGLLPTGSPEPTVEVVFEVPTQVAAAIIPTETPLRTATSTPATVAPTWTIAIEGTAADATATNTRRPALTATLVPTLPSRTPTPTHTPTETATPTPSDTPGPVSTFTRSPFPYTRSDDSPFRLRSFTNNNCLILAGEVLLLNGTQAVPDTLRVHVWDADGRANGIDVRIPIGSAQAYGQSGWEIVVSSAPEQRIFNIQLESVSGTIVSSPYQIESAPDCGQNVNYFIFLQNH